MDFIEQEKIEDQWHLHFHMSVKNARLKEYPNQKDVKMIDGNTQIGNSRHVSPLKVLIILNNS